MLLPPAVPQPMLLLSLAVPHTMLSPSDAVPQTMLSPSDAVPQTMLSPSASCVFAQPHSTPRRHALAVGSITPPLTMWLPHRMCLAHVVGIGTCVADGCAASA